MHLRFTLGILGLIMATGLIAQNAPSQSRQIWTEPVRTPAVALELAKQQLPAGYQIERINTAALPERTGYERHAISLGEIPLYGKQLIVAPAEEGRYLAAYPRRLPEANEVNMEVDETAWQAKLSNLLIGDDYVYTSHAYGIVPRNLNFDAGEFLLAAIVELEVPGTHRHDRLYLSAVDGRLIARHPIDCTFVPGTAQTLNYGEQTIETTQDGPDGQFRLYDSFRGQGIQTVGADGNDIYDDDNEWAFDADSLSMALDVHHGLGKTHDYFKDRFGRVGLDGMGIALRASTGIPFANAFYGGPQDIGIGAGDPNFFLNRPLSGIDVVAHEMAHGYTDFGSGLIYFAESGGLNEAFSDIVGVSVEYDTYETEGPLAWTLGEEASSEGIYIRNMADPNELDMPDTYGGNFWSPVLEVHTGSSIANYWYYLLVMGDSGTNDVGYAYDVPALGYDTTMQIVYDAWNNRLNPSSNYADCSIATIAAATSLYGPCSPQVDAVEEAWRAVNVTAGVLGVGSTDTTRTCDAGAGITFTADVPGTFLEWQFGDGESSTENPATHIYTEDGTYTASYRFLNCFGDTLSNDAGNAVLVSVDNPDACSVTAFSESLQFIDNCSGILVDDGGEAGNYSDLQQSEIVLTREGVAAYQLNFQAFDVESGYDFLTIYDRDGNEVAELTGSTVPEPMEVLSSEITLVFTSDGFVNAAGFVIAFNCIVPTIAPVAGIATEEYPDCRSLRNYVSDAENYPTEFSWQIDGETVGTSSILEVDWVNYGPGTYSLSLEVCNEFGCTETTETIIITDEVGTCESIILENGITSIEGCNPGTIYDDGGPDDNHANNVNATINLSNEDGQYYRLDFLEFALEPNWDYLYVFDASTAEPELLATYNGLLEPFSVEFPTSALSILFVSDGSVNFPGFEIEYTCFSPNSTIEPGEDFDWRVAPNPFTAEFNVSGLPAGSDWTFQLVAIDGRQLRTWSGIRTSAGGSLPLSAAGIPAGVYVLRAASEDGYLLVKRVVKQ